MQLTVSHIHGNQLSTQSENAHKPYNECFTIACFCACEQSSITPSFKTYVYTCDRQVPSMSVVANGVSCRIAVSRCW
jgi:hypothetical protein